MDLEGLHQLIRQLANGDTPTEGEVASARMGDAAQQAFRLLHHRVRQAGSLAALTPVSGTAVWVAPQRTRAGSV